MSAKNATALRKLLTPYIAQAFKAGRTAATGSARLITRAWAKEHGLVVSGRERIPASVVEPYHAAGNGR